jgi:hypothetical protein
MMVVFPIAVSRHKADEERHNGSKDEHNDCYGYRFFHRSLSLFGNDRERTVKSGHQTKGNLTFRPLIGKPT